MRILDEDKVEVERGDMLCFYTGFADLILELRKNPDLALARGVFGVPTIFVGERSFWGNDRLQFVERELQARAP